MANGRSPREVFQHHAEALGAEKLEEIVADYSDNAIFITPEGVLRGRTGSGRRSPSSSPTSRRPNGTCRPRFTRRTSCCSSGLRTRSALAWTTGSTRSCFETG